MKQPSRPESRLAAPRSPGLGRRSFLRGLGACVALPLFESLRPLRSLAGEIGAAGSVGVTSTGAPLRTAFVYFPNGANQQCWWPTGEGKDFVLGTTMQPLAGLRDRIQVIGGLEHLNAKPGNDGAGDHARANATFLTGMRARKTDGLDIQVGVSIDQVAAQHIGHLTRFPSLELSCDSVRKAGRCDSGYSCAYQYNLSWQSATTPMATEPNPRLVFERLFGAGAAGERQRNFSMRQQTQRSLLDFVLDDARTLQAELGARDKDKLDEYLTGVREIEARIQSAERFGMLPNPGIDAPGEIPEDYRAHMQIMYDLMALAFQTDSTRVATLLLAGDGTNRAFPQIGIPEGHHFLSHHRGDQEMLKKVAEIDLFYMEQFARFLKKLEDTKDVDGHSVLHNSMIVYGCGNSDGNKHNHDNLPVILAGGGGGTLNAGRYLKLGTTPMSNLFLGMSERLGVPKLARFGDSTDTLTAI